MKCLNFCSGNPAKQSHPSRGAWIEIFSWFFSPEEYLSHPSRGAWIEIGWQMQIGIELAVAPLTGCVD